MLEKIKKILGEKAPLKTDIPDKNTFESHLFTAESHRKNKQWELAIEEYEKAFAIESTNIEIIIKLSDLFEKSGNKVKQTEYLQKQFDLQENKDESTAWLLIDLYESLNEFG